MVRGGCASSAHHRMAGHGDPDERYAQQHCERQLPPDRAHLPARPLVELLDARRRAGVVDVAGATVAGVHVAGGGCGVCSVVTVTALRSRGTHRLRLHLRVVADGIHRLRQCLRIGLRRVDLHLRAPHQEIHLRIAHAGLRTQDARDARRAAGAVHAVYLEFRDLGLLRAGGVRMRSTVLAMLTTALPMGVAMLVPAHVLFLARLAHASWRGQLTRWSFTMPTACMYA